MSILYSEILESHYVWTKNAEHLFMVVFILIIAMLVLFIVSTFRSFYIRSFSKHTNIFALCAIFIYFVGFWVFDLYGDPEKSCIKKVYFLRACFFLIIMCHKKYQKVLLKLSKI